MDLDRGSHTYREILSQGEVWQRTLESFDRQSPSAAEILHRPFKEVLFTGCGSTYYLSLAAAAHWQMATGRRAQGIPASELRLFPESFLNNPGVQLVAVSRSGETTETLQALQLFQQRTGNSGVVVSVYKDSRLVQCSPYVLLAPDAVEVSVAQTRSFTSMFLLTQACAYLAAGQHEMLEALGSVPAHFQPLVNHYESLSRDLAEDLSLERFVFLGSGPNYGLACEAMLKMKEMSLSTSEAFHFMEFRHGPKSMVGPGSLVVGLIGDTGYEQEVKVLQEMRALGAKVLAIVDTDRGAPADFVVELRTNLSELQRAALQLPVLQLLAYHRSLVKGLNPDRPANLESVVRL